MTALSQQDFDTKYITSSEICTEVGVTKQALYKRRIDGKLPEPICVENGVLYIWERATIRPYIDAWKQSRMERGV